MADIYTMSDNQRQQAGTLGGGLVGATIGSQLSNALKDVMRAKGFTKKHPIPASLAGAGVGISSILGGIVAGNKLTESKKKKDRLPVEVVITPRELAEINDNQNKKMKKTAQLWFPIISNK